MCKGSVLVAERSLSELQKFRTLVLCISRYVWGCFQKFLVATSLRKTQLQMLRSRCFWCKLTQPVTEKHLRGSRLNGLAFRDIKATVCIKSLISTLGWAVCGLHRSTGIHSCIALAGVGSSPPHSTLRLLVLLQTSYETWARPWSSWLLHSSRPSSSFHCCSHVSSRPGSVIWAWTKIHISPEGGIWRHKSVFWKDMKQSCVCNVKCDQ